MSTVLIAFSAWSAVEYVDLPIVKAFLQCGHKVLFLGNPSIRTAIEELGATFVPLPLEVAPEPMRATRLLPGVQQIDASVRKRYLQPLPAQWSAVQQLLASERVDAVVADPTFLGAMMLGLLPTTQRPPLVAVAAFPLLHSSPDVAPFGLGMPPLVSGLNRPRNVLLQHLLDDVLLRPVTRDLRVAARRLTGQDMSGSLMSAPRLVDVWAQLGVPRFEYPRARLPENLRFIGPLRPATTGPVPEWWYEQDDRPLVHIAHGPASDPRDLVVTAIEAFAQTDVQVVVTAGADAPRIVALLPGGVPANVRIERAIPSAHLLPRASAVITQGDHSIVQEALRWGVPLVVAGTAEEKVEVNARVAWAGVGVNLRVPRPSHAAIRAAVQHVQHDPAVRAAASRIAAQISATDAQASLCSLVEDLIDARGRLTA